MMFDRYLPLTKALHVEWISRRNQFSPIPAFEASSRMVSPTSLPVTRSERTRVQDMGYHPILRLGWPSWYCIMHTQNSTTSSILLHLEVCLQILLVLSSCIFLHPLWASFGWSIKYFPHSGPFPHNHCRWCGQVFLGVFFSYCASPSSSTVLPHWVNIIFFLKPWYWDCLLEL